ncbi:MAG: glycosyl hydrolase [Clostridiales bacterium]|nr:glycosyl hydrolase [Clostridiales bacterium]
MIYNKWISKMTIRERALMLTGKDLWHLNSIKRIGLPSIMVTDGPHGLRKTKKNENAKGSYTVKSTCFPTASALACTWDRQLMSEVGNALADECIQERVSVLLGPGVNIKRSPLCGRNFEYFSEDPYLTGELAAAMINGVQEKGVGTSIKHFAANSTETNRLKSNSIVDERALREIYLRAFEIAVKKAQPWTVMSAYNKINGTYCTENAYLQNQILRAEWGFKGAVISDWTAVNDRVAALNAGLDIEMPSSGYSNVYKIAKAYRDNTVSQETLNTSVSRVLNLIQNSEENLIKSSHFEYDKKAHHELAKKAAEKSVVLLKNDDKILPLKNNAKVAVVGSLAKDPIFQGYGSSRINPHKVENAYDGLQKIYPDLAYAKGYEKNADKADEVLLNNAKKVSQNADVVVAFVGACDSDVCEGFDRVDMRLSNAQTALIKAVLEVNENVVVVVSGGSCVEMPWHSKVKSILYAYLLGEGGGDAIANIISGQVSPCGKLAETFPFSFNDTPAKDYYTPDKYNNLEYKESLLVGYRYYEKAKVPVMFPFGHGLSYTSFEYADLAVSSRSMLADDSIDVYINVENTGDFDAEEIVQFYVVKGNTKVFRPEKELKAFEKIFIPAGERKIVKTTLDRSAFEYYSTKIGKWCVEDGIYSIYVGSSSADLRIAIDIAVNSDDDILRETSYEKYLPSYFVGDVSKVSDVEFENLLGFSPNSFKTENHLGVITREDTLGDAVNTPLGAKIDETIKSSLKFVFDGDEIMQKIVYDTMYNIPIKRFVPISKGLISDDMIDGFVNMLNKESKKRSVGLITKGITGTIKSIIPLVSEHFE